MSLVYLQSLDRLYMEKMWRLSHTDKPDLPEIPEQRVKAVNPHYIKSITFFSAGVCSVQLRNWFLTPGTVKEVTESIKRQEAGGVP